MDGHADPSERLIVETGGLDHEAELRRLLRELPMPGWVSVAFEREPNFFHESVIQGDRHDVMIARTADRLVGFATRSVRWRWVNGLPVRVPYISALRVERDWRGGKATRLGMDLLRSLHRPGESQYCITTIVSENAAARRALREHRPGYPRFRRRGALVTLLIPLWRDRRPRGGPQTRRAIYEDLPDIAFCLQRNNVHRQFAPIWREADLRDPGLMLGLRPSDFTVVDRDGRLSAVVALWDQRPFKQSVIRDYKPWMRAARPVYNLLAPLLNMPRLPAEGQPVRAAWLSHLAVDQDDLGETLAVVCAAAAAARAAGLESVMLGLAASDPRVEPLKRALKPIVYHSALYTVDWRDGAADTLDDRPDYPEVALI